MTTIAEKVRLSINTLVIDNLYNKLERIEDKFNAGELSYIDYSSSKDDVLNDIHCILSEYLCPIDIIG